MWWSLMAENPTLIPYKQESWPTYPGVKVLTLWPQSPASGPVFPSLHRPTVSRGALLLSALPPSGRPLPLHSHTHSPAWLKPFGLLRSCLPSLSLKSTCLTSYPFPYLCLLIHPSVSAQMPSLYDGSPVLLHLQWLLQELTTRLKENLRDPFFSTVVFKLFCYVAEFLYKSLQGTLLLHLSSVF